MNLKYKENPLWKIYGSLSLLTAFIWLGIVIFAFRDENFLLVFMIPLIILVITMSCISAVFYYRITRVDYVRVDDQTISIFKSLLLPRKKINIGDVEQGRVFGNKFILILKNGKEIPIDLKGLTVKDFDRLKANLEESIIIS